MEGLNHSRKITKKKKKSEDNHWICFKDITYSKSRSNLININDFQKLDKIREKIAHINNGMVSQLDYIKIVSTASTTSLQDDDGALKKGVALAYVRNDGLGGGMSESLKGASWWTRTCFPSRKDISFEKCKGDTQQLFTGQHIQSQCHTQPGQAASQHH